jgi:uncharacterized membrane protein
MRALRLLDVIALLSALGCGLMAGFFFAFSTVIMKALGKVPPAQGVMAMQTINVVVINPLFLAPFLGTAASCVFMIVAALRGGHDPRASYWLAAGAFYLVGTLLVTMVFNVPRNNALAAVAPDTSEAARLWATYLTTWTMWNHVRTIAALAAAVLFTLAYWPRA